jgi:hypothetical protein
MAATSGLSVILSTPALSIWYKPPMILRLRFAEIRRSIPTDALYTSDWANTLGYSKRMKLPSTTSEVDLFIRYDHPARALPPCPLTSELTFRLMKNTSPPAE